MAACGLFACGGAASRLGDAQVGEVDAVVVSRGPDARSDVLDAAVDEAVDAAPSDGAPSADVGAPADAWSADADAAGPPLKAFPYGVFQSPTGVRSTSDNPVTRMPNNPALRGLMIAVPWDLCDAACLFDRIQVFLDEASARGVAVALSIVDGPRIPAAVKASCAPLELSFRGARVTSCLPWDDAYLAAKVALVADLGARFDAHPALGYVYFTASCSTNGNEGHCRTSAPGQPAVVPAGYSHARLAEAYNTIMDAYRRAFPRTPITFEVHALFDSAEVWQSVWDRASPSGRVGIAAWWCAERLSLRGADTPSVWPLVQAAAAQTFSVCQTVASLARTPYEFSDVQLGLDYGTATDFDAADATRAFADTLAWVKGRAVHVGQPAPIAPFAVLEAWYDDLVEPAFVPGLSGF